MTEESPIRIKLILSMLSGKPLKLKNIRKYEQEPGLKGNRLNSLEISLKNL